MGTRDSGRAARDEPAGGEIRTSPARSTLYFVLGGILTLVGIVGIAVYTFTPRNTPVEGQETADGLWQAGLIIGSAVAGGAGLLLLGWGLVTVLRRRRDDGR
ncbi:hypothetical protein ABIQ69_13790 [Agromyces sp. G08B096]|uniref:Uncharacterized protein n=1 Tax=Agromyces sp. G08B096 TaxID=3156399 RepID=A0AAU7W5J0_9MICO